MQSVLIMWIRTLASPSSGREQAALEGERGHTGEEVAAVLAIADEPFADADLEEQVVEVDARPSSVLGATIGHLAGERVGAADAVDLARVGRAHDPQQQFVAFDRIAREGRRAGSRHPSTTLPA